MKQLKEYFILKAFHIPYESKNSKVAFYGIGGMYTDKILHYEVEIIYIRKDQYGEREHIATNDEFGRDRSRCFKNDGLANNYFDELTKELTTERILSQG
jgi:hypothetical protein